MFSSLSNVAAISASDSMITIADAETVAKVHAVALQTPVPKYAPMRASVNIQPGQIAWVPVGSVTNGKTITINISGNSSSSQLIVMLYDSYYNTYGDNNVLKTGTLNWYIASSATYQIAIYNDNGYLSNYLLHYGLLS